MTLESGMDNRSGAVVLIRPPKEAKHLQHRSEKHPNVLFVTLGNKTKRLFARNGILVKMEAATATVLFSLLSRRGGVVSRAELEEFLWADDPDGGPLQIKGRICACLHQIRIIAPLLGLRVTTYTLGWSADFMSTNH